MKFNIKFLTFEKVYIYFCLLALLNIFFSTDNIYAKTFNVDNVEISTPFEINFDKNRVIDRGFTKAFDQMILSITQTKDLNKFENISLSLIKGMIDTFSIKKEKFINNVYYLSLNVSFNKKRVLNLLESKSIFPSLLIKKKIFFMPIIIDEEKNELLIFSESYLFNNWNSDIKKYHLLNYILPTEDLEDFRVIKDNLISLENYDFNEIIKKYNLNDYILAIIFKSSKSIKVLNKIYFNKKLDLKNLTFENYKLNNDKEIKLFIENLKTIYEDYWKSKNEINTSVKLTLTVSINNHDSETIKQFERKLNNIDLIYNFYIDKFDNKNNIYKIVFNGSPGSFLKIMKNNTYEFDTQNHIWTLK
tara:strand:- start:1271 stop:2350 length:1080 start_codon:yes stop_codon:yes gene_type:complete